MEIMTQFMLQSFDYFLQQSAFLTIRFQNNNNNNNNIIIIINNNFVHGLIIINKRIALTRP